jgi:hypothetical protein
MNRYVYFGEEKRITYLVLVVKLARANILAKREVAAEKVMVPLRDPSGAGPNPSHKQPNIGLSSIEAS